MKNRKTIGKKEQSLYNLWENIKKATLCAIYVPEGEERKNWAEKKVKRNNRQTFSKFVKEHCRLKKFIEQQA